MKISSMIPAQPGLKVCVRIEREKGDADFKESFIEYDILAWAVVDVDNDGNDRVEPMYIGPDGSLVVFSQHMLVAAGEPKFSDMDYEIDDSALSR